VLSGSGGLLMTSQQVVLILQLIKLMLLGLIELKKLLVFHISAANLQVVNAERRDYDTE
jgi:hypothetical protein